MPTNDERREVAARLRKYTDFDFGDSSPYWYLMKAAYGDVAIHDDNELFDRLADLIEPEPQACEACPQMDNPDSFIFHLLQAESHERACQVKHDEHGIPRCGKCKCVVYDEYIDAIVNYCPNCGVKVTK